MHDDTRYKAARKRIKKLKDFYSHIIVYIAINIMLFFLDLADGSGGLDWFYFPLIGWGAAVLIHAFDVYILDGFWGPQWEERKMQELMGEKPKRKRPERLTDYDDDAEDDAVSLDDLVAHADEDAEHTTRQGRR